MAGGAKKRLGRGLGSLISGGGAPRKEAEATEEPASAVPPKAPEEPEEAPPAVRSIVVKPHLPPQAAPTPVESIAPAELPPAGDYREIPVAAITPSPFQARREIDSQHLTELAESIRSEGLLQPIVVRPLAQDRFELIAGERRWRAHQQLGVKRIMARIIKSGDASSAVISLIENLQREGLNPIDEALGFASLLSDFDLTQEAVAERVGRARASVANALRLLQLDRETQGYLAKGMLSVGHAKVLLGVEDSAQRTLLARRVVEVGLSVRELERLVKTTRTEKPAGSPSRDAAAAEDTVIANLEKELSSQLNTKVQLKHTPKKGRLIIEYYGNEDLQRILEKTGLQ